LSASQIKKAHTSGETLARALRKCRHQDGRQWGGYLTVMEALALLDAGATKPSRTKESLEMRRLQGDGQAFWFYFDAKEPLASKLRAAGPSPGYPGRKA